MWQALGLAVSLFPAIDCLSVFPMNAIFLSNNLLAVAFERRWHAGRVSRQTTYACRLLCCAPRHRQGEGPRATAARRQPENQTAKKTQENCKHR